MAKKQKKATPERTPTKHQLSKWQRQMKTRRIVIIAAVVFLVGILSWVGYGSYKDYRARTAAWREVLIEVNGVPFTMEYFVDMLDVYTTGMNSTIIYQYGDYLASQAASDLINGESLRQAAKEELGIEVTAAEIDAELKKRELPDERIYRDLFGAVLLEEKVKEHFGPGLNATMEQAHVQVVLVESQEVATELIAKVAGGGNFTALAAQSSCNSSFVGDLGWLPEELMPNPLVANAAFNFTLGTLSQPIYDATAVKEIGYWLIEVTDKQDSMINTLVMLLGSQAEAAQIQAELAAGGNFSALARSYSQHASKADGGKLGPLKQGDMGSTAFDRVAFNLTVNTVSNPVPDLSVRTTGGYWIVKTIDRGDRQLDEQVREELKTKRYIDWLEAWKKNSTVENRLDKDKRAWAIDEVLKRRNA